VNSSYFGLGCVGIGQAAPQMLGVVPGDMTLEQAALMAGIPNEPSLYSSDRQAADVVLMQMEKYGLMPGAATAS
jgi:membrane peptidoglycan carboxypeptidase